MFRWLVVAIGLSVATTPVLAADDPIEIGIGYLGRAGVKAKLSLVELPEMGRTVTQGQSCGTIESVKAVSELYSPASGKVVEVNPLLSAKPESVNKDPHGTWLYVIELSNPADIDNLIEIKMSYDRDPDAALENCRFWAPLSLTAEQKHSVDSALEMERLADELPIEQVAKRWIVASDPDEAVAHIKPYVDAGLNHLVFHGPGHDQERFLTQFAEDVLPKLRALA